MSSPHLAFTSAVGGSVFMEELLEVVAAAVRDAGGSASTHRGDVGSVHRDAIHVVVPHEYLSHVPRSDWPPSNLLARTIAFAVEHPGTASFRTSESLLSLFGAVVDINADSVQELRRIGHRVERFSLGYSPLWDRWGGAESEREIDVAYLGTAERGRSVVLARAAPALAGYRLRWLTPPHEPMLGPRPDFLLGRDKHELLARSRVLLNVHREYSTALEWVRVLEAMCNGSVVVTEPAADLDGLLPGRHLVTAHASRIGDVAAAVLKDPERQDAIRREAYRYVRDELDMAPSATRLIEVAADLAERTPRPARLTNGRQATRATSTAEPPLAVDTPCFDPALDPRSSTRDAGPVRRLGADLAVARLEHGRDGADDGEPVREPRVPLAARSARTCDVDVVVVRGRADPSVEPQILDLALGTVVPRRVIVVEDGTPIASPTAAALVLHHREPRGEGWCRNRALEHATAPRLLVLTPDLRLDAEFLERVTEVDTDIVHCPVRDPEVGLVGALPLEQRRIDALPYLGSGYLVSRELIASLGGWLEDPWCEGMADHALWRRASNIGARAVLVPQPLLWRTPRSPRSRPVDLDPARAWQSLQRHLAGAS